MLMIGKRIRCFIYPPESGKDINIPMRCTRWGGMITISWKIKKLRTSYKQTPIFKRCPNIYIYIYIYIYLGGVVIIAYIAWDHLDECSWHILVDSIVLETIIGLLELLTIMIDLNK
jgi:hypothetical protein